MQDEYRDRSYTKPHNAEISRRSNGLGLSEVDLTRLERDMHMDIYMIMYVYIYIYIHIHTYIHIHVHIYIYIERERDMFVSQNWLKGRRGRTGQPRSGPGAPGHTCHILPPSEIDLGLCLAVFAGSGGKYLFHRIG